MSAPKLTRVKDLKTGDRVALEDGVATITKVVRDYLIEVFDDTAYRVDYRHEDGATSMILGGRIQVEVR